MTPELILLIVGAVFLGIAIGLRHRAKKNSERRFMIGKATPLPIALCSPRDDAWIRGTIDVPAPVIIPHFGHAAAYYTYREEEQRTRITTDSKGRTRTETYWATINSDADRAPFSIHDAGGALAVGANPDFEYLPTDSERLGIRRHTTTFLPATGALSVCGSIGEDGASIERYQSIPLLVTPVTRTKWLERTKSAIVWSRRIGAILLAIGLAGIAWAVGAYADWWPMDWQADTALTCAGIGIGTSLVLWVMSTYNQLVALRNRVAGAFKQIDVDLKNRHDLVPQLVETVSGASAHERELLEEIAGLRAGRVTDRAGKPASKARLSHELHMSAAADRVIARVEAYPDLETNENFQRLFIVLRALEEKIAHARDVYNEVVRDYNTRVESFPTVLVAQLFGTRSVPYWGQARAPRD